MQESQWEKHLARRASEILLRKAVPTEYRDIELSRMDLDGARILFDDYQEHQDRNILVAESGQIYIMNEPHRWTFGPRQFSLYPISIEITGRTKRLYEPPRRFGGMSSGERESSVRIKVDFGEHGGSAPGLGLLLIGSLNTEVRLSYINHHYNLAYVRRTIEEEYEM